MTRLSIKSSIYIGCQNIHICCRSVSNNKPAEPTISLFGNISPSISISSSPHSLHRSKICATVSSILVHFHCGTNFAGAPLIFLVEFQCGSGYYLNRLLEEFFQLKGSSSWGSLLTFFRPIPSLLPIWVCPTPCLPLLLACPLVY
jgi:hypothetical protein